MPTPRSVAPIGDTPAPVANTGHAVARWLDRLLLGRYAFWKLFIPLLLVVVGTGAFSVYQLHINTQMRVHGVQRTALYNREIQLQEEFDAYLNILHGLAQNTALQRYVHTPTAEHQRLAEDLLLGTIRTKAKLTQLRWLDETGMERLRINQSRHTVTRVPPEQMK
ncbi:MAG: hypothetical protein ACMV1D_06345, partial [Macromonas sp.]